MVIYIREVGARARREKTTFNKPAANVVVTSEKATFRLETVAEGVTAPWGLDFLPDGRILVTEKAGKLRIIEKGAAAPRAGHRHPGGARQGPGRAARRRRAPRLPSQRLDLPVVQRPRRERQRDDEDRPRQAEGQRLRRDPGRLQGAGRALHRRPQPLRRPHRVRPQGAHLLQHRRARPGAARAGAEPAERQGAPDQRGRHHPEGQPVRRQAAGAAVDLHLRQPQPAGPDDPAVDRRDLGSRARAARRRRAERHPPGPQLRLAGHHLRHELQRHAVDRHHRQGGDGAADHLLDAVTRGVLGRPSTPATSSRSGRATSCSPRWRSRSCAGWS